MARIGTFLLFTPIVLLFVVITLLISTQIGFFFEAQARGYISEYNQGTINQNGCYVHGNSTFCKSDYGFLGIKQWMDAKDKNVWYDLFDKSNQIPQNICKERVLDYHLETTNSTTILDVKCNQ